MAEDEYGLGEDVESACPTCGTVAMRTVYDIGSGSELSCANCEWCWGANGQALKPLSVDEMRRWAQNQAIRAGERRFT